jgi:DNA ligase-1
MNLPILYKQDKNGTIREWYVVTMQDTIMVNFGVEGGETQRKHTYAKPKNVGRANATTADEQAKLEAKAKWTKQIEREGYCLKEDLGKESPYIKPMLALDATKVIHRVDWSKALGSPKLDGVRTIWRPDLQKLQSRKGTFYEAPQHIIEQLKDVTHPLDGELYIHGVPLNELVGAARKANPLTEQLQFHAFDVAVPDLCFTARHRLLSDLFYDGDLWEKPNVCIVNYEKITDHIELHNQYVEAGYEGLMIRHWDSEYDFGGRSPGLFKFKMFKEDEFKIIGMVVDADGGAVLKMVTEAGDVFGSRPRGTLEYRSGLLQGLCAGKMATVRYFAMTSTDNPVPQFPVVVAIGDLK